LSQARSRRDGCAGGRPWLGHALRPPGAPGPVLLVATAIAIGLARAALVLVRVEGDSMIPAYRSGDAVLVARKWAAGPIRPGDVVVCRLPPGLPGPGEYLIKRVTAVAAGEVTLRGDGPRSYDSRTFGAIPRACLLGRVIARLTRTRGAAARLGILPRRARAGTGLDPARQGRSRPAGRSAGRRA